MQTIRTGTRPCTQFFLVKGLEQCFKPTDIWAWIMRYDLTDLEWNVIEPLLPTKRRGVKPKNNRRVLNGIFWVLRAGAPWRDMPERYGPYTTAYNRFNRWRKAGIWDRLMDAIVQAHDGKVQMIDSSIVRVHQHASGVKKRVEIVVSAEVEAGSPRKSTPASTRRGVRSAF